MKTRPTSAAKTSPAPVTPARGPSHDGIADRKIRLEAERLEWDWRWRFVSAVCGGIALAVSVSGNVLQWTTASRDREAAVAERTHLQSENAALAAARRSLEETVAHFQGNVTTLERNQEDLEATVRALDRWLKRLAEVATAHPVPPEVQEVISAAPIVSAPPPSRPLEGKDAVLPNDAH